MVSGYLCTVLLFLWSSVNSLCCGRVVQGEDQGVLGMKGYPESIKITFKATESNSGPCTYNGKQLYKDGKPCFGYHLRIGEIISEETGYSLEKK